MRGAVQQTSLATSAAISGHGLHTGEPAQLVVMPAQADFGVRFVRSDLVGDSAGGLSVTKATIPASPRRVRDARLGVWLENAAGASVRTVEHLMAALALSGVDNALIEIDGPEVPILDGSAAAFMELIGDAGLKTLGVPRRTISLSAPLRVEDGERFVEALPGEAARIEVTIDFEDAAIGRQSVMISQEDGAAMVERLARARTFCLLSEVESLRAAGLGRGGSLENALVVDRGRLLNETGLRDPLEFALHKALDLVGDLALIGAPFNGLIRAYKPGHDLNTRLAGQILDAAAAHSAAAAAPDDTQRLTA